LLYAVLSILELISGAKITYFENSTLVDASIVLALGTCISAFKEKILLQSFLRGLFIGSAGLIIVIWKYSIIFSTTESLAVLLLSFSFVNLSLVPEQAQAHSNLQKIV
jgi:hypothetical protein